MKTQVMLDLETWGTRPGSITKTIGAVKFKNGEIYSEFYEKIDIKSAISIGLTMDPDTVIWWMGQADAARTEMVSPGKPICEVLNNFSHWIGDGAEVWGNGVGFDNTLLSVAYEKANLKLPWKYSADRCYRTVKNLYPGITIENQGTLHNALDDARSQALHLMKILNV